MLKAWLRFFRVVNLPTVPGDVLVGAAAAASGEAVSSPLQGGLSLPLVATCAAGVGLYLFGLADNDIVGASTDADRPIPNGEISIAAARVARGLCLFAALVAGAVADLPQSWWFAAFALAVTVVAYNRTKWSAAMGLCRGLNVLCGGCALGIGWEGASPLLWTLVAVWTAYVAAVTKYSEGEELDAERKARVGLLVGAIVHLQLLALLICYLLHPVSVTRDLLVAGALLLILLRLMKRLLPEVSAS